MRYEVMKFQRAKRVPSVAVAEMIKEIRTLQCWELIAVFKAGRPQIPSLLSERDMRSTRTSKLVRDTPLLSQLGTA